MRATASTPKAVASPTSASAWRAGGRQSKGSKGRALSPEELRKLIEQGAEIRPSEGEGSAEGEGCT